MELLSPLARLIGQIILGRPEQIEKQGRPAKPVVMPAAVRTVRKAKKADGHVKKARRFAKIQRKSRAYNQQHA